MSRVNRSEGSHHVPKVPSKEVKESVSVTKKTVHETMGYPNPKLYSRTIKATHNPKFSHTGKMRAAWNIAKVLHHKN